MYHKEDTSYETELNRNAWAGEYNRANNNNNNKNSGQPHQ